MCYELFFGMCCIGYLLADAANNSYMDFSELYKIGMKFEPNIYDV